MSERCVFVLKDGSGCRSVAVIGEFCAPHARKAGAQPDVVALVEPEPVSEEAEVPEEPNIEVDAEDEEFLPAAVRRNPREAIRDLGEQMSDQLEAFFRTALQASKGTWVTCGNCNRRSEVEVPDWSARSRIVETMLEQGFGKIATPREQEQNITLVVERVAWFTDDEMHEVLELAYEEDLSPAATLRALKERLNPRGAAA